MTTDQLLPDRTTGQLLPDRTADQVLGQGAAGGPLAATIDAVRSAVGLPGAAEPDTGYLALARLSGHLAAMRRTVFPHAAGRHDGGAQLRAVCLSRARKVEWALRGLECRLAGDASAAGLPVTGVTAALARHLDNYWPTERALVTWIEGRSGPGGGEKLARAYMRALSHAPTRPHPRCSRSGPLRSITFWLHGRWDRVLDTMDSRPGVGDGFPALVARPCGDQTADAGEEAAPA